LKTLIRVILISILLSYIPLAAQDSDAVREVKSDSCLSATAALVRSLIVPGWGQIYQERLVNGTFFYGASATFYYRSFFYLYHYKKGNGRRFLNRFQTNLSVAIFFHVLNLVDVSDVGWRECPQGWQGKLLSDEPVKSPWGASLRSAVLPGWGQFYNESYFKAVGYLAVDGYLFYKIREADIRYRDRRNTKYRDDRSRYSWYFGVAYFLTIADAFAGAYLFRFDEAMQLTFLPEINRNYIGINASVSF